MCSVCNGWGGNNKTNNKKHSRTIHGTQIRKSLFFCSAKMVKNTKRKCLRIILSNYKVNFNEKKPQTNNLFFEEINTLGKLLEECEEKGAD